MIKLPQSRKKECIERERESRERDRKMKRIKRKRREDQMVMEKKKDSKSVFEGSWDESDPKHKLYGLIDPSIFPTHKPH